jgi:hypothetical protein
MGDDISDCIDMRSYPDTGLQADHECKLVRLMFTKWEAPEFSFIGRTSIGYSGILSNAL